MIRLTAPEHIKTHGEFQLDGLWVKSFVLHNPPDNTSKQTLTIEVVPFKYMDDGSKIFDLTRNKKVHLMDAEQYLITSGDTKFLQAYFATENAIAGLLSDRTEWTAVFQPPEGM